MSAGWLRERVTLQMRDPDAAKNEYNERDDVWIAVLEELPAQVYALTGSESTSGQQVQADLTHRVVIRTPSTVAIRPTHRFMWNERLLGGVDVPHVLDVKQVIPLVTKRGYTQIMCTENLNG